MRQPDPRVQRSRQAILRAALDELGERGYGAFAMEGVAMRAAVGKATIYRHWPDRLALIADAFETLHAEQGPDLTSGSHRERLERILRHVAELLVESPFSACIPALIEGAACDPRLRAFHYEFQFQARRPLVQLLADGVTSREFPSHLDPELVAIELLGALFFQRLMTPAPFDPHRVGELVCTLLGPPGAE